MDKQFAFHDPALKALIDNDPRPGFRGACTNAYVSFCQAIDARAKGDAPLHNLKLLDGADWLEEARAWNAVEAVPNDFRQTTIEEPDVMLLLRSV